MLSYQHGYHAGNFADVIKHFTLTRLISYLTKKDKPLLYLETHAGRGLYDLQDKQALKTNEASEGVALFWEKKDQLPAVFTPYLQALHGLNPDKKLRYYPGSPWFAINLLRREDRIVCAELHPGEFEHLQQLPHAGKRVLYKQTNGLDELRALLPPVERRGLIFLDPPYEVKTDYKLVPAAVKQAYQRFATGVYCLWYPIVDKRHHEQFLRGLKSVGSDDNVCVEFYLSAASKTNMKGSGLWIINPPYTLSHELKIALDSLKTVFNPGGSTFKIFKI